jgi:hypothetical protein
MRASVTGQSPRRSAAPPGKLPVSRPARVEPEIAVDDVKNSAEHQHVDSLGVEFPALTDT